MLQVSRNQLGDTTVLSLKGLIDENVDVAAVISSQGPVAGEAILNLAGVQKINSVGVRNWMLSMKALTAASLKFRYVECSPSIVECLNLIANFSMGAPVDSIQLPYRCESCRRECLVLAKTSDLIASKGDVQPVSCPNCKSGTATFE